MYNSKKNQNEESQKSMEESKKSTGKVKKATWEFWFLNFSENVDLLILRCSETQNPEFPNMFLRALHSFFVVFELQNLQI